MSEFKTQFKPYRTFLLLVVIIVGLMGLVYFICFIFNENLTKAELLGFVILTLIFAFGVYSAIKVLIQNCVRYSIRKNEIELYSFFTFKRKTIFKSEIIGFSKSWAMAKGTSYDLTIIYLKNRNKIILHELDFYNYFEIKPNLRKFGYKYLGHEPEEFEGFFTRVYKFDNEK